MAEQITTYNPESGTEVGKPSLEKEISAAEVKKLLAAFSSEEIELLQKHFIESASKEYEYKLTYEVKKREEAEKKAKELEIELQKAREEAYTDGLTRVRNRRYFDEAFAESCGDFAHRAQNGEDKALVIIDLDYFKQINDNFGHAKGDEVLVKVANCLSNNVSVGDIVARYGGEEFAIDLRSVKASGVPNILERLRAAVQKLIVFSAEGDKKINKIRKEKGEELANYLIEELGKIRSQETKIEHYPLDKQEQLSELQKNLIPITISLGAAVIERNNPWVKKIPNSKGKEFLNKSLREIADRALYLSKKGGRNRATTISGEELDNLLEALSTAHDPATTEKEQIA